jgi:hypothetical protein
MNPELVAAGIARGRDISCHPKKRGAIWRRVKRGVFMLWIPQSGRVVLVSDDELEGLEDEGLVEEDDGSFEVG